jgi:hypothetical protein
MLRFDIPVALLAVLTLAACGNSPPTHAVHAPVDTSSIGTPPTPVNALAASPEPDANAAVAEADANADANAALASANEAMASDQGAADTFNASFDSSTHDSCVSSAERKGVTADFADSYCTCVVTQLDQLPVQEKMSLARRKDLVIAAANACKQQ